MEERKITLVDDDQTLEFYVVEETKLNGANYLLVTDAEDDDEEGDCYILKDMSGAEEADALYEFVEDEDELEAVSYTHLSPCEDPAGGSGRYGASCKSNLVSGTSESR